MATQLLIFSDLDGTLLNHHDYSFAPALPALRQLAERHIPLILCSSKTADEILVIRQALDNHHPFIVENGSALWLPEHYLPHDAPVFDGYQRVLFGLNRDTILSVLQQLRERYDFAFQGFHDMSLHEVMAATELEPEAASRAQQRHYSEPLLWQDSDRRLQHFKQLIAQNGLRIVAGGRFLHIMGNCDKATAMAWLVQQLQQQNHVPVSTIALGDSPNDIDMLQRADQPVVINTERGHRIKLPQRANTYYSHGVGPQGWAEAITRFVPPADNQRPVASNANDA